MAIRSSRTIYVSDRGTEFYLDDIRNSRTIYVSDRGTEFYLDEMASSHLVNAIGRHRRQLDTLDWVDQTRGATTYIRDRQSELRKTVDILTTELMGRDPRNDHDAREDRVVYMDGPTDYY